jgi:hypothetical protein
MARCFDSENKNSQKIRTLLAKMLADPKNFDFSKVQEIGEMQGTKEKFKLFRYKD